MMYHLPGRYGFNGSVHGWINRYDHKGKNSLDVTLTNLKGPGAGLNVKYRPSM
jgi:hypothetical protein